MPPILVSSLHFGVLDTHCITTLCCIGKHLQTAGMGLKGEINQVFALN